MAADLLTPGPHHRRSEFVYDPQQRMWLYGCCGQLALAMAAWNATGQPHDVLSVYRLMRAHGLCAQNGASTPDQLVAAAKLLGLTITEYQPVYFGWPGWQSFLARHVGKDAVVLELHNAYVLVDEISHLGENANTNPADPRHLQNHYINGFGASGDGWLFADGDNYAGGNNSANNFNAADVLQRYSFTTLGKAQPCAAIAIHVPASGGGSMAWTKQTDGSGKDARGNTCGAGDMAYLEAHNLAGADGLMSETYYAPNASFLPLDNGHIVTWNGSQVAEDGAQALVDVWLQLQAAKSVAPALPPNWPAEHAKAQALDSLMALYGVK